MNILYKITYLPHLKNQTPPYYYVGSKYNYDKKYFGSPSSKQKDWYSENFTICKWWKQKIKNNKDDFYFEIISEYDEFIFHNSYSCFKISIVLFFIRIVNQSL